MHYPLLLYVILIYDFKIKKKNKFYSVQAAKIKDQKMLLSNQILPKLSKFCSFFKL